MVSMYIIMSMFLLYAPGSEDSVTMFNWKRLLIGTGVSTTDLVLLQGSCPIPYLVMVLRLLHFPCTVACTRGHVTFKESHVTTF